MGCRLRNSCYERNLCLQGPQGAPGLPCDLDYGVLVYDYIHAAFVSIATRENSQFLGQGFWVSDTTVLTAWSLVEREALGVRVVVTLPGGLAVPIDAVVAYAIPALDLAFITVEPGAFASYCYTQTILKFATNVRVGQAISSLKYPRSLVEGLLEQTHVPTLGYLDGIRVGFSGNVGMAYIRTSDFSIAGMLQQNSDDGTYSVGISADLLIAALQWASTARTNLGTPVLCTQFLPGPLTIPTTRGSLALGIQIPTDVSGLTIPFPVITEPVNPLLTDSAPPAIPLGAPATGAWIFNPTLTNTSVIGSPGYTISVGSSNEVSYPSIPDAIDTGFARAVVNYGAYTDIRSTGTGLGFTDNYADITSLVDLNSFYLNVGCALPSITLPTAVYVSYFGLVAFSTASSALNPVTDLSLSSIENLIANPFANSAVRYYAAPFAYVQLNRPFFSTVHFQDITVGGLSYYVIQWTGFTIDGAEDPYSFQVWIQHASSSPIGYADGSVRFHYRTTSGSWANEKWLVGTRLTGDDAGNTQPIQVTSMPLPSEVIYFGTAARSCQLYLARPTAAVAAATLGAFHSVIGPARNVHGYEFQVSQLSSPGATIAVITDAGTLTPNYQFAIACYTWGADPIRVHEVGVYPIGNGGVNNRSLITALVNTAPKATDLVPVPTRVVVTTVTQSSGYAPSSAVVSELIASARSFGDLPAGFSASSNSLTFIPNTDDARGYQSVLMYLPVTSPCVQPNFVSLDFDIEVPLDGAPTSFYFVVQLAGTNSTFLTTQFSGVSTDPSAVAIEGDTSTGVYTANYLAGWGDFYIPPAIPLTPTSSNTLQFSGTLTYTPSSIITTRVNALVVGIPPRAFNVTPATLSPSSQLARGTVTINAASSRIGPMVSTNALDTGLAYAIVTKEDVAAPTYLL